MHDPLPVNLLLKWENSRGAVHQEYASFLIVHGWGNQYQGSAVTYLGPVVIQKNWNRPITIDSWLDLESAFEIREWKTDLCCFVKINFLWVRSRSSTKRVKYLIWLPYAREILELSGSLVFFPSSVTRQQDFTFQQTTFYTLFGLLVQGKYQNTRDLLYFSGLNHLSTRCHLSTNCILYLGFSLGPWKTWDHLRSLVFFRPRSPVNKMPLVNELRSVPWFVSLPMENMKSLEISDVLSCLSHLSTRCHLSKNCVLCFVWLFGCMRNLRSLRISCILFGIRHLSTTFKPLPECVLCLVYFLVAL